MYFKCSLTATRMNGCLGKCDDFIYHTPIPVHIHGPHLDITVPVSVLVPDIFWGILSFQADLGNIKHGFFIQSVFGI